MALALREDGEQDMRELSTEVTEYGQGELHMQIRTARQFPRSVQLFMTKAKSLATISEEVADACIYALPRGGKTIEGPSARLAEILVNAWGNCRAGARVINEDDRFVTAQGIFFDVEQNSIVTFEVRRRITNKRGEKYDDDMIGVTANAACSIALRNAVLKGIPKAFWGPVYDHAKKVAIGDAETISAKRLKLVEHFQKMGVTLDRLLPAIGKPSIEDIGEYEVVILKGAQSAIKHGDLTVDGAFPPLKADDTDPSPSGHRADELLRKLRQARARNGGDAPSPSASPPLAPALENAPVFPPPTEPASAPRKKS